MALADSANQQLLLEAAVRFITRHRHRYGVLIDDVEGLPLRDLVQELGGHEQVRISLVGVQDEHEHVEWARVIGFDAAGFGIGPTHAVALRNDTTIPSNVLRIAVVGETAERLHSLSERGYEHLDAAEFIQEIARIGVESADNDPQANLWRAISSLELVTTISLQEMLDFAAVVATSDDRLDAPRTGLPRLGLLRDPSLFRRQDADAIAARLLKNKAMVERLQQATDSDRQNAYSVLQAALPDERAAIEASYNSFLRLGRGDQAALGTLTLDQATHLLSPPQSAGSALVTDDPGALDGDDSEGDDDLPGDDAQGTREVTAGEAPTVLAATSTLDLAVDLLEDISQHLKEKGADANTFTANGLKVRLNPHAGALQLSRIFMTEDVLGGSLRAPASFGRIGEELGTLLEHASLIGQREIEELRLYMRRAGEVRHEFAGEELLMTYLEKRRALLPYGDLLATEPLLALVGDIILFEAVDEAVSSYVRLLSHIKENYAALHTTSPTGAVLISNRVLALDLAIFRTGTGDADAAIVLPVNPLTLWKHLELATLLRTKAGTLSSEDRDLLLNDLRDVPEPLLALFVPIDAEDGITMAQVGRFGPLPLYRQTAQSTADAAATSIRMAADRLAMLYPPVREHLRVCLLDPESLEPVAHAIRSLVQQKQPFGHVTVTIATTRFGHSPRAESTLGELHNEGQLTLRYMEGRTVSDVAAHLAEFPVHVLVISGRRERHVAFVTREATRLHPLAVPHHIVADPITQSIRMEPRSARPEDDTAGAHPYAPYFDVVASLSNRRHQDPTHVERKEARDLDLVDLARHAQFCVVSGFAGSRGPNELLYLAQGGPAADEVFTAHPGRIVDEIEHLLKGWNYHPRSDRIHALLVRLEELGGEGLFSAFSAKSPGGLAQSKLREKVGLAVALDWYSRQCEEDQYLVLSLDGPLASAWLSRRTDGRRADLLGFRLMADGSVSIDVIEVKSYEATGANAAEASPAEQLRAVARLLMSVLAGPGDLLLDRRRELLRRQVFLDGLLARTDPPVAWVNTLNDVLDGKGEVDFNLLLLELALDEPSGEHVEMFEAPPHAPDAAGRLPLQRIRLGEAAIQPLLGGLLTRPRDGSANDAGVEFVQQGGEHSLGAANREYAQEAAGTEAESATLDQEIEPNKSIGLGDARSGETSITSPEEERVPSNGLLVGHDELEIIDSKAKDLYRALQEYGVSANPVNAEDAAIGPTLVRYKVRLKAGESIAKLRRITEELQRELALEKEPMAGNLAGTNFAFVDLPRPVPQAVPLKPLLDRTWSDADIRSKRRYTFPAGLTPDGKMTWLDVTSLPHMLVAGETGAGKSVFLRTLITSLAALNAPDRLRLILVDPKRTDFLFFNNLPHLHGHRVISEAEAAVDILTTLIEGELEERTKRLEDDLYLNIHSYNDEHPNNPIPPIVVVIDEFADLADVLGSRGAKREAFDLSLRRLAQRARSVGIHLIIATQRPTTDIVNGTIKANLPTKVSFRLGSNVDSRTILDQGGAEHLFGRGDMLLMQGGNTTRLQGLFVDEKELRALVRLINERWI